MRAMYFSLSAVIAIVLLSGCHERPTVGRSEGEPAEMRHRADADSVSAPGTVEPWLGEVKLASMEPGQLIELLAKEGQAVRTGELLARLEDSQERHGVSIAEAELRQAIAAMGAAASTAEDLRAAEAQLRADAARASQQESDTRRARLLGATGVLSRADVESAVSAAEVADATREAAEVRLVAVKRGARTSERKLLLARKEAAEAAVANARAALARREVRSSLDGVVLWSRYHAGEFYSQAQGPLFVLGHIERLQVRLEVDDGDAARIQEGARCRLRTDGGELLGEGAVMRIALEYGSRSLPTERPSARTDARVREVFVEIDAPKTFAPGQRVWGDISRSTLHVSR